MEAYLPQDCSGLTPRGPVTEAHVECPSCQPDHPRSQPCCEHPGLSPAGDLSGRVTNQQASENRGGPGRWVQVPSLVLGFLCPVRHARGTLVRTQAECTRLCLQPRCVALRPGVNTGHEAEEQATSREGSPGALRNLCPVHAVPVPTGWTKPVLCVWRPKT